MTCAFEGIIPALESSHALAYAAKLAPTCRRTRSCWSTFPDAATRTCIPSPKNPASSSDHVTNATNSVFPSCRFRRRKALIPFITAGDPASRPDPAADAGAGGGRRRHHRAGRAVFRSDGRWPDHPARLRARPGARHEPAPRCWRWCASSARRRDDAGGADGLCQSDRSLWASRPLPAMRARPASMACWWSTIRPRSARVLPPHEGRASIRSSCWRRPRPRSALPRSRAWAAATSTTSRSRA
jgi:hypothetical protein